MTEQEKLELKQEIKEEILLDIKGESQSVDELEEVDSLVGVNSLPAMRGTEVVVAPISLLGAPAQAAAAEALAAKAGAEAAAASAGTAADNADEKAQAAQAAAAAAQTAVAGAVLVGGEGEGSVVHKDGYNSATGSRSVALGSNNTVTGNLGVALGSGNNVSGARGFASGDTNVVEGNDAVAIGDDNHAVGNNSFADGHSNYAEGSSSHAEGKYTTAEGNYSHAEGYRTTAVGESSHAQGKWNVGNNDTVDEVGIGTGTSNRKNAEETKTDGKKYIIGIGGYDGTNAGTEGVQSLQEAMEDVGPGGNTINVTEEYPLANGYYTLATAIAAVEAKRRAKGRCVTYEASQGKYVTKQFVGTNLASWETESSWDDFGGGGTVKSVTLNGQRATPDSLGDINLTVQETEVDASLDATSTNPVQNAAVTAKFSEVEAGTVFSMDAELSVDESTVTLSLKNRSGAAIASVDIPAGSGGGGGGETTATKIVLGASVNQNIVKEGGQCLLTYTYDHQYVGGDDAGETTGQKADIEIRVMRGAIQVYAETLEDQSKGTYTLDLTKYLQTGTTDIYVKATTTDPVTGNRQSKQAYVNVRVVNLTLASSYSLSEAIQGGGYSSQDSAVIPWTVQGSGTKTVYLYVDGVQADSATVTRSGTTNGSFSVPMTTLSAGRHTVQLVAENEVSETLTLRSESIYIDIFKRGSTAPLIGTKHVFADGRVLTSGHLTPQLAVGQYEQLQFEYVVYDSSVVPALMSVWQNGQEVQIVSVPRTAQTYTNRFTAQGMQTMKLVCGETEYPFTIEVSESSIDVSEATYGLQLKLSAVGRSNGESDPAHWEHGPIHTTFENVDWQTSGWTGESLKLMNGAKAVIDFKPFQTDAATAGITIEAEIKVSNITDKDAGVVSCLDGTKGFLITADKAMMYTGSTKEVEDDEGNTTQQPVGVGRQYGSDEWKKIAFVVGRRADGRLMELYVNGTRCAADIYGNSDNFVQDSPQGITLDSTGADVEVRIVRVYNRALTDNEETDNHIVDRTTLDEMAALFEENDVLSDDGLSIDFQKLRNKGKGIMLVVRQGGLDPVNAENNKKTDFLADVHLWLPDGRYIYMHNVYVRIQGTSSTKYPTKNYRIYCAKGETPELYINGVQQQELKIALRPGQKKVKVLCAKADYSDSSMVQNTGGAKLWNNMMKALDFLTPPQMEDRTVRTAIDGYPIDVFSAESLEDTPVYYGQYNLNHDKSDWQEIIGMEGVDGFTPDEPIAFEFLNNTQPLCLFQGAADLDAQAAAQFDNALEFNYPSKTAGADTKWANAPTAKKDAFKRLWGWIRDCVPSGATPNDISSFTSPTFRNDVEDYLDLNFLLCWWLFTDYFMNVDQRAKNMIAATWNGLIWYLLYYDGDTQLGDRNDSMLAYLYDVTRDTWDSEKSKFAFEGHDSWLWCLVLANFESEIKEMATTMREKLTEDQVNEMFDNEQQGNWCGRAYNKSGEIKYIKPQTDGVNVNGQLVKYPYIYALKGDKQAFRHWFIHNRFALLDAKYETGNYLSDNIDMYMTRQAEAAANTIVVKANEQYYFGYGTNNAPHLQASEKAERGETVTLTFANAFTVNDPIRIYGASRIAELDMRGAAGNLTGDVNLNKCKVLRVLDIQAVTASTGWCLVLDQCRQIQEIYLQGQTNARTGTLSSTELDFSSQTRLQSLNAQGVNVKAVVLAKGCPVSDVRLGSQIETLRLEYLPNLQMAGLSLQNWSTVKTLRFSNCPHLNWQTLLGYCNNIERVRIEGINVEDDGTLLNRYKTLKGVDADGNAVDYPALAGTVQLTSYMEDEEYAAMQTKYPELTILQPEYSVLEFDDSVSDDANVSNLDNGTGYKYGSDYVPSGHVQALLKRRHRCLAKITRKPTTRNIIHAGVDAIANNLDGEATIYPLHDSDSRYYADSDDLRNCAAAALDGSEGDWMMYEPHKWFKGINDYLNSKHYVCISSNASRPKSPACTTVTLEQIQEAGDYRNGYKIMSGKGTLANSYTADSSYAVCRVDVAGYSRVRFPSVPGTNLIGSVFTDSSGNIVDTIVVSSLGSKFQPGMYLISEVPAGAASLYFTIQRSAEFDMVVLSNSTKIEDMEPEWVEEDAYLCGVVGSSIANGKLRACITGGSTAASMPWTDFHYYSVQRGMQQIDGLMHNWIANLFYAKYGRRNSQAQCGAGSHSNTRTTGGTAKLGMQDTLNTDGTTVGGVENNGLAFYKTEQNGETTYTRINNTNCLGYEDIYGHKYDMMDGVDVPNGDRKWRYMMPDGSYRRVQAGTTTGWITAVSHGRYMDMTPVAVNGSSSTYYCDYYSQSESSGRVVYRGDDYANANGGVSCANAHSDASNSSTSIGSRLAFRGKIEVAESVAAFKAIVEVA